MTLAHIKYVAKALCTGILVVLTFLTTILSGTQDLRDVTFVQWLLCAILVLGAYGIVYRVPNGPKPTS